MTAFRVQAKRTTASGPPADLEFGELAYSDADQQFYVGRPEGAAPATFKGDIAPVDLAPVNAAIAAIETEQGTQNEAIALINTEQDSQDAAIAALAAASSGQADAIDSLAARPLTYGFTYDQQAEPLSPAAGATWRERSAGGLIVGEWEWSGSLWLGSERSVLAYSAGVASASGTPVLTSIPKFPALLVGYSVNLVQPFAPQDSTNYWEFRHIGVAGGDWVTTIGVSTVGQSHLTKTLTTPVVLNVSLNGENRVVKTGLPGNLRSYLVSSHYKLIRP